MTSVLNQAYFHDEAAAFDALEAILWPDGPTCPLCGATDRISPLKGVRSKPSKKHPEGEVRLGLWKCYHCRKQFRVTKNTVFESAHLKLHQWFQCAFLLCSSKKGCSSNQLARTLGCTVKSAWFASHRIREAMRAGELDVPFGTGGGPVEADETFLGKKKGVPVRTAYHHKMKVLTLIDRNRKQAKSVVVQRLHLSELGPIIRKNIAKEAHLMTDEARHYQVIGREFAKHDAVTHGMDEYVRGAAHCNTAEGFFSIFKRGMRGIYQHCDEKHLHKYLAEFDFRYNHRIALGVNDAARTVKALAGIKGKRLYYREPIWSRV
jgi:transposase-like protein